MKVLDVPGFFLAFGEKTRRTDRIGRVVLDE
jgi:hypothetical protein